MSFCDTVWQLLSWRLKRSGGLVGIVAGLSSQLSGGLGEGKVNWNLEYCRKTYHSMDLN